MLLILSWQMHWEQKTICEKTSEPTDQDSAADSSSESVCYRLLKRVASQSSYQTEVNEQGYLLSHLCPFLVQCCHVLYGWKKSFLGCRVISVFHADTWNRWCTRAGTGMGGHAYWQLLSGSIPRNSVLGQHTKWGSVGSQLEIASILNSAGQFLMALACWDWKYVRTNSTCIEKSM